MRPTGGALIVWADDRPVPDRLSMVNDARTAPVLAIDQGTSATKALVVGPGGTILGHALRVVFPEPGENGAVVQDPSQLLESVVGAGRDALAAAGVSPAELAGVGIGNQGETVLAWDRSTGRPAGPAISWQDRRASPVADELAGYGERLTELTGLRLDPYFAAPKMTWLASQVEPGLTVTTIDAWVVHQLCGAFVTDAATASRTMLLDLAGGSWSPEACEIFGLAVEDQPSIVGNAEVVGETGAFGAPLPITALIVDQQAALLAQSCLAPGEAKCTYGTGAFLLANAGTQAPRSTSGLSASVAWQIDGTLTYCLDGQLYTAAAALRWLESLGFACDPGALAALTGRPVPGPATPVFVPALAGLGAPDWAPAARGAWSGLSLGTSSADLVDTVLWGIAAAVSRLVDAMAHDTGVRPQALRVDGGLSNSVRMMQAQAELLQMPVERYPYADATALGVAALTRLGAGGADHLVGAIGTWTASDVFEPRIEPDEAAAVLARFDRAVAAAVAHAGDPTTEPTV